MNKVTLNDYISVSIKDSLSDVQDGLLALDMMAESTTQDYEDAQKAFQYVIRKVADDLAAVRYKLNDYKLIPAEGDIDVAK